MDQPLRDLIRPFGRELRASGYRPRTEESYTDTVKRFCTWLEVEEEVGTPLLDHVTKANIVGYLAYLRDLGQSDNSVVFRWIGLRRFCRWLVEEEYLTANPMLGMRTPSPGPRRTDNVLSDDDLRRLLKACDGKTFYDRRDEALIRVLAETGLRRGELIALQVEDVDLDARTIQVRQSKGGKPREVYVGSTTVRALDRYLRLRATHTHARLPDLWLSQRGALTIDGIREVVLRRVCKAGLHHIRVHDLRHTWVHKFLAAGGDAESVRRLAGWSSYRMLQIYASGTAQERAKLAAERLRLGDRW